ncbi:NAD(P)-binding protein [Hypoxylon rubiginosum]|uniref:NAD(P)-binding protein n=1 Tax=Hypoxylon rubiginosum TaxID=110542 RepID=A0ACC0D2S0_9PEZI|nr:NAD(P)-binding protein [Hypoxylon rubiginosum]
MSVKSVLVTGCSAGGIGGAIALNLATSGHHVFATARNTAKIAPELSSLPNVTVIQMDVTSSASVTEAAKIVTESGRGLDALVNNAGGGYGAPILDMDIDKAKRLHEVNVWGVVRCVKAFSDLLIESRGRIVNMSSVGAVVNMPWIAGYASSKAALNSISETLRHELSPFGVTVVTIMGGVITSLFHENDIPDKLPEGSRYIPIEDAVEGWTSGRSKPKGMPADQFAAHIADDIVGNGKGGLVWKGPNAGSVKIATSWLPSSLIDSAITKDQGLEKLAVNYSRQ